LVTYQNYTKMNGQKNILKKSCVSHSIMFSPLEMQLQFLCIPV
jgi:hypothetical protein